MNPRPKFISILKIAVFLAAIQLTVFADTTFTASIDGLQQVPQINSNAAAAGTVILNNSETQITVTIFSAGLGSQHLSTGIHGPATPGSNGSLVFTIGPGNVSQNFAVNDQQAAELKAGLYYFQVKTVPFPAGELRGQIHLATSNADPIGFPSSSGALDATFGTNGIVTTVAGTTNSYAQSVAVQRDGKIVVGGYGFVGADNDFAVVRYNPNGTLDETFDGPQNGNGIVNIAIGSSYDQAFGIALQDDGKIVLVGETQEGASTDTAVLRLNPDGTPDNTFDGDGLVIIAVGSGLDLARSVIIQADGKIVCAGTASNGVNNDVAVIRLLPNGALDQTFDGNSGNGNGIVTTAIGAGNDIGYAVANGPNNTIVVGGYYFSGVSNDAAVLRYDNVGRLDTTFAGDGIFTHSFSSETDEALAVTLQSDGKIVIAGCVRNGGPNDFLIARIGSNGSLDQSFGNAGVQIVPFSSSVDIAFAVAVQADGKVVAAGFGNNGSDNDFAVTRLNADGSLDSSFDYDGRATATFGPGSDTVNSVAIQADGKIIAVGRALIGSTARMGVVRFGYGTNPQQNNGFITLNPTTAIRFDNAFATGTTRVSTLNSAAMPPLPSPLTFIASPRVLGTSVMFSGDILVRLTLPAEIEAGNFNAVRIMQFENGVWTDKTADTPVRDFASRTIYARIATLSPFAAASPIGRVTGIASISGRIGTDAGANVSRAIVNITLTDGTTTNSFTNPFSFYRVNGLAFGENYIVRAKSKRRLIAPRLVSLNENLIDVDLIAY